MTDGRVLVDVHARYIICAPWLSLRVLSPSLTPSRSPSPRPTMSVGIFHSAEHYSEYDKDSEDQMPSGVDLPALPQPEDDQQQCAYPMTIAASNVGFPSPTCNPHARFPAESMYSNPPLSQPQSLPYQFQSPPQRFPSATSHLNYAENGLSNTPLTAVSSNEARVSLPSREGGGREPRSRPFTGAHEECIVSVPISAAGNPGCYSSEDMDGTVLEDETLPSNDRYIRFMT